MTLLDMIAPICKRCGGTILQPTAGGASRGTCYCPRETERETEQPQRFQLSDPNDCCRAVIDEYESIGTGEQATMAKQRGGIALYCRICHARVVFADGRWQREGAP